MEVIGWAGTALVVVARLPADTSSVRREVRWGISVLTWLIWLAASVLLLTYCAVRQELLMCAV
jgi:hypothetical protein